MSDFLIFSIGGLIFLCSQAVVLIWISYLKRKSENYATKQDIAAITKLTEEVKKDVSVIQESEISFQTLRREAIINFYEKYSIWLNHLLNVEIEGAPDLMLEKNKFDTLEMATINATTKLRLFVEEYPDYEKRIEVIAKSTRMVQQKYFAVLGSYLSITSNIHLYADKRQEYTKYKFEVYDTIFSQLVELTNDLRLLIKNSLKNLR